MKITIKKRNYNQVKKNRYHLMDNSIFKTIITDKLLFFTNG